METPEAPKERFTGYEKDGESELYYAGARYYDPLIGRWPVVDPLADEYPGVSPYSYVLGNPLVLIDPTGACPEDGSEGDAGDGDGYCLAEVVVEADRYEEDYEGFGLIDLDSDGDGESDGKTFFFDASTQGGYQGLHDFLMQSNDLACSMVGNEQFSMNARSAAMAACIHSGQAAFLNHPYSQAFLGLVYGGGVGFLGGRALSGLGALNRMAATRYLARTGQLGNFSSVSGFSLRFGNIGYKYHAALEYAVRGSYSTTQRFGSRLNAWSRLGLGYPGSRNGANLILQHRQFGLYVNGTVAPQGVSLGGAQQFYRVAAKEMFWRTFTW